MPHDLIMELEWRPPEIQQLYNQIQAEIAGAFRTPDWITDHPNWVIDHPEIHRRLLRQAYLATEKFRTEAIRLYKEHSFPKMIIKNDQ